MNNRVKPGDNPDVESTRYKLNSLINECGALTGLASDLLRNLDAWDQDRLKPFATVLDARVTQISKLARELDFGH